MTFKTFAICCCTLFLVACGSAPVVRDTTLSREGWWSESTGEPSDKGNDIVIYALGLIDTSYKFGGKNPEAGLDCSGMVSYVYQHAADIKLTGSAAMMAKLGRVVSNKDLRPGDLVFFNTMHRPASHVGVYIGDGRFVDAPSTNGKVRIDKLDNKYYAQRFEQARRYFD
ncbi:C40 family peptidase [Glaciimonas soli]|uniref:NlpC/P60 domain-containing protein n=1 Tax=Glaciimonas soli TaxID=2590999 RepID=A0A843YVU6_9BURK|nr:C40 family peptidase [Glaciimonas soli]MQR01813.1 hypothetical protein [Glaciimonas soli]